MQAQPDRPRSILFALTALLPLLAGGCRAVHPNETSPAENPAAAEPVPDTQADAIRLLDLLGKRLALMHEVARWKWTAHQPIADPARERELLDRVAQLGQARGLEPDFVRRFFAAQIEAGKLIQRDDFERWRAEPPTAQPGRGLSSVRRDIDALNEALTAALAALAPRLASPAAQVIIGGGSAQAPGGNGVTDEVLARAIAPLRFPLAAGPQP